MDQTALNHAAVYFHCCELSYMEKGDELSQQKLLGYSLHHRHDWTDTDNELQYIILEREHPRELIVSFRGLLDSFAFRDLLPGGPGSVVSKNRKQMLMMTNLIDAPCGVGRAHAGLVGYFERMRDDLASFFTPEFMQEHEKVPIICTGFSMGSGIALQAGLYLRSRSVEHSLNALVSVINFASPKPGDHALIEYARANLQTYQTYFVKKDPIASFPGLPDYQNGGDLIVLVPNETKLAVNGQVPEWLVELHPYKENTGHEMITAETFSVGTLTVKDAALPTWGSLRNAGKYHRMQEIKTILRTCPAPYVATEHARAKALENIANGNTEISNAEPGGFFSSLFCPAPARPPPGVGRNPAVESRCSCS